MHMQLSYKHATVYFKLKVKWTPALTMTKTVEQVIQL